MQLYVAYRNDVFGHPSAIYLLVREVSKYLPTPILDWRSDHSSDPRMQRVREMKTVATDIARELVHEKAESLLAGKGSRDVFSLLSR